MARGLRQLEECVLNARRSRRTVSSTDHGGGPLFFSPLAPAAWRCSPRSAAPYQEGRSSTDLARYPQAIARFSDKMNFRDRHHICRTRTKTQIEAPQKRTFAERIGMSALCHNRTNGTKAKNCERDSRLSARQHDQDKPDHGGA